MGKPNKEKKKREQKRLAEKRDPVLQAKLKAEKQEQFKENIKRILRFTAKALLPAVLSILIFGLVYKNLPVLPHNKAFCAVGFIGAALLGAGISLFIYGKKAYKILIPTGLTLAILSYILISKPELTGENSPFFYYFNIVISLFFIIFYVMFRDGVYNWLRGRKISDSMMKKSKKGAKNFWWYEELHKTFGLSSVYTLNKNYTVFFAAHFTVSVLFGWAEPLLIPLAVSLTLLALMTSYMAGFARMQRTVEKYGCKFVFYRKNKRNGFDSTLFELIVSLFPIAFAALFWYMINALT